MKYVVILGDGMADTPVPQLGGKTPLEAAATPNFDRLAKAGELGLAKTVPDSLKPGSDVANLSVIGYDPRRYYTGRSPLEAVSMGISLSDSDRTFRCNLVTLSEDEPYAEKMMVDYSSDEITTAEAAELIREVDRALHTDAIRFHPGISYRHCMVWDGAPADFTLTPPHDISGRKITQYLPAGSRGDVVLGLMEKSYELLKDHPVNRARRARGLHPANSIWLWGDGSKPQLPSFWSKYGLKGAMISAVDLLKGIGLCIGLRPIDVPGATGNIDTNFSGKAEAAIRALTQEGDDFVYIHVEAPDECGHHGEVENKIKAIEMIDEKIAGPVMAALQGQPHAILLMPDHPTPLEIKTHSGGPVPYVIFRSDAPAGSGLAYTEAAAASTGIYIDPGYTLMDRFLGKQTGE